MTTLCVVLLSACNFSGKEKQEYLTNIEKVKYYIHKNFPKTTLGKALDTYKNFTRTEWHNHTKDGQDYVLFSSYYTDEKFRNFRILLAFEMRKGYENLRKDLYIQEGGIRVKSFDLTHSAYYPDPDVNEDYSLCEDVKYVYICNVEDIFYVTSKYGKDYNNY